MKKKVSTLAAVLLAAGMLTTAAFAHGGHGSGHRAGTQAAHAPCTVEGCAVTGQHQHDGAWYCGQPGDYAVCAVQGCTAVGQHEHNGTTYSCGHHGGRTHRNR